MREEEKKKKKEKNNSKDKVNQEIEQFKTQIRFLEGKIKD